MIPLRDTVPSRSVPFATYLLIAVNAAVFLWQLSLGPGGEKEMVSLAFVPARFFGHEHVAHAVPRLLPIVTSMFLHGGWLHLLGNMLYLFIFGNNVEDALGHLKYVFFYTGCGAVSALAQGFAAPSSSTPMVGASGAIAGVLGAYFVLFPSARVVTLVPIFIFFQIVEIPAFFFLLFWFLLQFLSGAASLGARTASGGGIAWWAHVGGFAVGLLVALVLRVGRAASSRPSD